jgi:hypothetical protein
MHGNPILKNVNHPNIYVKRHLSVHNQRNTNKYIKKIKRKTHKIQSHHIKMSKNKSKYNKMNKYKLNNSMLIYCVVLDKGNINMKKNIEVTMIKMGINKIGEILIIFTKENKIIILKIYKYKSVSQMGYIPFNKNSAGLISLILKILNDREKINS